MKLTVIMGAAALMLCSVQVIAGSVQIGLVNGLEFEKWKCGGPVPGQSRTKTRCWNAKFDETSTCDTMVITNDSSEPVKVELQLSGPSFEEPPNRTYGVFSFGPQRCEQRSMANSCEKLDPGDSCYQGLDFWPRDPGTSEGHIEVRVTGSGQPLTKSYDLVATADYPPELLAADQVRLHHLDELLRIPHVLRVSLVRSDGDIVIEVEVASEENIPQVERSVPPKLEGYRVEVVQQIGRGYFL